MPLDEHIEDGHGEREPSVEIRPAPMHDFLEVADERQHRQDRLHQHAILPLAPLTEFQVGGIALGGMEAGVIFSPPHLGLSIWGYGLEAIDTT